MLVYHRFSSEGYIKLFMEHARIKVQIVSKNMPEVVIDNFDQTFNDGIWHQIDLSMGKNQAIISVDKTTMVTTRLMEVRTGAYYMIGRSNVVFFFTYFP